MQVDFQVQKELLYVCACERNHIAFQRATSMLFRFDQGPYFTAVFICNGIYNKR